MWADARLNMLEVQSRRICRLVGPFSAEMTLAPKLRRCMRKPEIEHRK